MQIGHRVSRVVVRGRPRMRLVARGKAAGGMGWRRRREGLGRGRRIHERDLRIVYRRRRSRAVENETMEWKRVSEASSCQ